MYLVGHEFLHVVLIKDTTPSFQSIFFDTLSYNEDCKKFWSSIGNYQNMRNESMQIY